MQSQTGLRQLGFITNRHVAVDLDSPSQKMFHPLPPNLGPGVYLGAVERATSFVKDDLWYGIFAGSNPGMVHVQIVISCLYTACRYYFVVLLLCFLKKFVCVAPTSQHSV